MIFRFWASVRETPASAGWHCRRCNRAFAAAIGKVWLRGVMAPTILARSLRADTAWPMTPFLSRTTGQPDCSAKARS